MFNVLLDPLPTEWKGYPIDSDFQVGIQISQCLVDTNISKIERFYTAVNLLFPQEMPDIQGAADAVHWFMSDYNHDNPTKKKKEDIIIMDFDIDQWRIYAAFLNQYHIDLNTAKMHWFTFMGLLSNIGDCAFKHVMDIRAKKITVEMSTKEKQAIRELKKIFSIKSEDNVKISPQEQKAIDDFMKFANINK